MFEQRAGRTARELLGRRIWELFPKLGEDWYEKAGRAALLGEIVIDSIYFAPNDTRYYITASQVIRPGFCSFTYQEAEGLGRQDKISPFWPETEED